MIDEKKEKGANQIEEVITSAMDSLRKIVDVNTVIGQPIPTIDGRVIVPISKVTMGFLAGGGEYFSSDKADSSKKNSFPFAGGSGAYVQLTPLGFLTESGDGLKTIMLDSSETSLDKLVDTAAEYALKAVKKKL